MGTLVKLSFAIGLSTRPESHAIVLKLGGASRDRTGDLLHAMQALSQLSYGPTFGTRILIRCP